MRIDGLIAFMTTIFAALAFATSPAIAASSERSVYYSYNMMGRQLSAKFDSATGADGVTNVYDGFGDLTSTTLSMGTFSKTLRSTYDGAGRSWSTLRTPTPTHSPIAMMHCRG